MLAPRPTHNLLSRLASFFYGLGARLHRSWMRRGAPSRGRPACAVISVGGLTIGGAGKTPVAARLARGLARRGHRVVLASRGYRGAARERVTVVSDGVHVYSTVEEAGDEALVLVAHAPGVPVIVGRDRRIVGHHAVSAFDAQILVLDDGFQHHRLARDLDIVCVDGRAGLGNGRVVPAGPLREPRSALAEADWLCWVEGPVDMSGSPARERAGGLSDREIEKLFGKGDVIRARRRPLELVALEGGERRSLTWLEGRSVGLLAGIARPDSLRQTLAGLGAHIEAERLFPDHHAYRAADLSKLDASVETWITTEKDAFKILPDWIEGKRVWVLRIEVEFDSEEPVFDRIEEVLRAAGRIGPEKQIADGPAPDRVEATDPHGTSLPERG